MAVRLHPTREAEILARFPSLTEMLFGERPSAYEYRAVSIFDAWLGKARSQELDEAQADYDARSIPLDQFNRLLLTKIEALGIAVDVPLNVDSPTLHEFTSPEEAQQYAQHCDADAASDGFFRLILPEVEAVYLESWDFTNVFFLLNLSCLPLINEPAEQAGVHVLERSQ